MAALRSDIEKALDDLISNEEGMRFQGLAVVLAKKRWPDLISCERKKDLGADAIAKAAFAAEGTGKVLACSITAKLKKVREDAEQIKKHFNGIDRLVFATPVRVSNELGETWAGEIQKDFGYELAIMSREDIITSLMDPSNVSLLKNHLGMEVEVEETLVELVERVRSAANEVAAAWSRRLEGKPLINLRALRLEADGRDSAEVLQLGDIGVALDQSGRVVLEGPAGRGKTTSLIQLARANATQTGIRLLVDLPEWSASRVGIFQFIAGLPQFQARSIDASMLARVSMVEHFSFLLNGWNEVGESDFHQAEIALRALERDFPAVGILVATRSHHIAPPVPGSVRARLLTLTRVERASYLAIRLGGRAEELRRKLDSDRVLDDLTRTPFFLSEVASIFEAGATIPATKIGVLRAVTGLVERSEEHRNHLRQPPLSGRASDYLAELATRMTAQGGISISEEDAYSAVSSIGILLKDSGLIATSPEPAAVLSTLCAHHVLERHEYPAVSFRFEHQQFQEFYAALGVQKKLSQVMEEGDGDGERKHEFTKVIVNEPAWAEPLRMIANEIGDDTASTDGADAVRRGKVLTEMALRVDPVFAAELARLCGLQVWKEVGIDVGARLRALYAVSDSRYKPFALTGMLASGSEDFKDIIVPILSGVSQQDRLGTYRTWSEFHLSSLGADWRETVASWHEQARVEFVSELLHQGNVQEIASFALSDPSVKVKEAAIQGLQWIGAKDEAAQLLESLDANASENIVQKIDPRLLSPAMHDRAMAALQRSFESATDPLARVGILLKQSELGLTKITELKQELGKISGRIDDHQAHFVIRPVLDLLRAGDAPWVSAWVAARVAEGSLWHETWVRLITTVPQELKEGLLRRLEGEDFKHAPTGNIISVLAAAADIAMAERAFLKLCELRRAITRAPDERHEFEWAIERQVEALLRAMPVNIAVAGVSNSFSKAPDAVELDVITRVFGSVGRSEPDGLADLDPEVRERFRTYLKNAVPLALQQDDFFGEYKANVASVLALVGTAADMKEMQELIRADIERVRRGRAARAGGDRSRLGNGGSLSYATWHIRALVRLAPVQSDSVLLDLLNEPEYERSVAEELARLVAPPKVEEGFIQKVDYERIWQARSGVREEPQAERRRRFAAAFRDRIEAIFKERSGSDQKRSYDFRLRVLGLALATIDSHGSSEMIFEIMSLPDEWDNWPRISAYEALLFNGVTLPADKTLALLDSCLDRFRKYGVQQQDEWMVIRFLCLLPFVDDPKKGIDKIRELISALRIHSHELGRVVEAMGHSRTDAALPFLRDLVSDSRVAQQLGDAWIRAVGAIDTADARDLLLSFVDPRLPALPVEVEFGRDDVLVARIVALMKRDRAVGQRVLQLCETEIPPAKRALLARVVSQFGSVEGVSAGLMLIDDAASPQVPYEIHQQLEAAFVEKRPYGGSENTYTLEPRSSNAIRTKLLEIAYRDERRRKSAFALLAQVEEWRLEYGRPTGEPRNPAFEEGEHWPPMPADA